MRDLYRRERRRLRADKLLIARRVERLKRREIWRNASLRGFTSLSRALLGESPELWLQVFGVRRGWTAADERRVRKAAARRAQRQRMARHQAVALGMRVEAQLEGPGGPWTDVTRDVAGFPTEAGA